MDKILCPYHREDTPSMVIYPSGWAHCYGCKAHVRVEQLGVHNVGKPVPQRKPEEVGPRLQYIRSLPTTEIRGLRLPHDASGYYIVWPSGDYFKHRPYAGKTAGAKYRGPAGVPKPLFICGATGVSPLAVVIEGELNALSVSQVFPGVPVYSPGGAGDFYSKRALEKDLPIYVKYEKILIVADKDSAGAIAAIELQARLLGKGPKVRVKLMDPDANDILAWMGTDALKEALEKDLEL